MCHDWGWEGLKKDSFRDPAGLDSGDLTEHLALTETPPPPPNHSSQVSHHQGDIRE